MRKYLLSSLYGKMMAPNTDSGGKNLATVVADVVSDAADEVTDDDSSSDDKGGKTKEDKDTLDSKTELFVRRIIDGVTKNIADIMQPKETEDESDDGKEEKPKRRKPTSKPADKPKSKSLIDRLMG